MSNYYIERFSKKESCLQVCLDFLYYNFYGGYPPRNQVSKCSSLIDTYRFLKRNGFSVQCKCHPIFFLNPFLLVMFLISNFKKHGASSKDKLAILTYSSALEFYGITDSWNHYVCEIKNELGWQIYDSYYGFIRTDYPNSQAIPLTHETISKKRAFRFIIWR